ncbi:hypothetical protein BH11MYX1_BH11MYX1_30460 [soil metagenome]
MATHNFNVSVDDQVYLEEGGEELGAVRQVASDYIVVYVENFGDHKVDGPAVKSAHDGKVILDRAQLSAELLNAIKNAHSKETE